MVEGKIIEILSENKNNWHNVPVFRNNSLLNSFSDQEVDFGIAHLISENRIESFKNMATQIAVIKIK